MNITRIEHKHKTGFLTDISLTVSHLCIDTISNYQYLFQTFKPQNSNHPKTPLSISLSLSLPHTHTPSHPKTFQSQFQEKLDLQSAQSYVHAHHLCPFQALQYCITLALMIETVQMKVHVVYLEGKQKLVMAKTQQLKFYQFNHQPIRKLSSNLFVPQGKKLKISGFFFISK